MIVTIMGSTEKDSLHHAENVDYTLFYRIQEDYLHSRFLQKCKAYFDFHQEWLACVLVKR